MACHQVLAQNAVVDPEHATAAHLDLAGTPHAGPLARLFLREQLRKRLDADTLQTAELLTTELVANVVLHARTSVHVGVTWDDHNLLVTVQDQDTAGPVMRQQRLSPDAIEMTGRGLLLIASLADDFGWARLPDEDGKVMWFALALATSPDGARDRTPAESSLKLGVSD